MEYQSVSIKSVIGNVIRNTGITNTEYIENMNEWIPEAMALMKTKMVMDTKHEDLTVKFHKTKMPCSLQTILAIEYKGQRLAHYTGDRNFTGRTPAPAESQVYISKPKTVIKEEYLDPCKYTFSLSSFPENGIHIEVLAQITTPSNVFHGIQIDITEVNASLTTLQTVINSLGMGTFTCTWNSGALVIDGESSENIDFISYKDLPDSEEIKYFSKNKDCGNSSIYTSFSFLASTVEAVNALSCSPETYYTELGYINTSFCDGTIRVFFKALPVDADGFPLIPDNQDYKQAIYWYVRGMMIGAGYNDKLVNYNNCEERFEKHAARALSQIKYPSVDKTAAMFNNSVRLIFNENAINSFFENQSREGIIY